MTTMVFGGLEDTSVDYEAWIASKGSYARYNGIKPDAITLTTDRIIYCDEYDGTNLMTSVDNVQKRSYSVSHGTSTSNLVILRGGTDYGKAKLYNAKIYGDNVLLADFVPVLDSYYIPAFYDKVSGQLFHSATTTPFFSGNND